MLSDGQYIMTHLGDVGVIYKKGTSQTYNTYWVKLVRGDYLPIHEDNLFPIDRPIYDIAKGSV